MLRFVCLLAASLTVAAGAFTSPPASAKTCFPVETEVVSLGEANARAYAKRSLDREIERRERSLETSGRGVGKVSRGEFDCAPYPNLLGADEWQCAGSARVCAAE